METVSCSSGYWIRKIGRYERLNGSRSKRSRLRLPVATLGAGSPQQKRVCWKLKMKRKFRFFKCFKTPKQIFIRLRDGYVKMMLHLSQSRIFADRYGGRGGYGFGRTAIEEYDERLMVEIYKSMVLQEKLKSRNALNAAGAVVGGARTNLMTLSL